MNEKWSVLMGVCWLLLVGCSSSGTSPTATRQGSRSPQPLLPATVEPAPFQDLFLRPTVVTRIVTDTPPAVSEGQEPWCLGTAAESEPPTPWETGVDQLTAPELADYLERMGVIELCLPPELGAPSLGVDWNAGADPPTADAGRRIRIGFEGIGGPTLIFATYDFGAGSEYVTHATAADYEAIQAGVHDNTIVANGTPGFLHIDDYYGAVQKAYVFPFANHYIALTYGLSGGGDPTADGLAALEVAVAHPPYPPESARELHMLDEMIASLRLRATTSLNVTAESPETSTP